MYRKNMKAHPRPWRGHVRDDYEIAIIAVRDGLLRAYSGGRVAIWAAEREEVLGFAPGGNGVPDGWELFVNVGEPDLALVQDDEGRALKLRARASSFSLQRKVAIDLKRTPFVVWQWKVTELPQRGDFRQRATDDQAAQLYVVFSWEGFRKEAMAYIWDSTDPEGATARFPP